MTIDAALPLIAALLLGGALFLAARGVDEAVSGEYRRSRTRLNAIAAVVAGGVAVDAPRASVARVRPRGRTAERLQGNLRRAGMKWSVSDYLAITGIVGGIVGLVAYVVLSSPLVALGAALVGALLPTLIVRRRAGARAGRFNAQVVGAIELIASSLRSGFGFMQSLEVAAREQPEPMATELRQTMREVDLGISVEEALEHLVERMRDDDLGLVVSAVLVQRRVGGDLGEVLLNIASMIRDRIRVRGEIKTLTAQARMSSWIIGMLPVALGAAMTALSPDQMSVLWTDGLGRLLLAAAITLEVVGFAVIRRVARVDY